MSWHIPIIGITAMLIILPSMFMDDRHDFIPLLIATAILMPCGILTLS